MKNLYSANVDQSSVDNLISGTLVPCKVIPVTLAQGTDIVPRGTLLASDDGTTYSKHTAGSKVAAVLMLDVDTSDPDELAAPAAFSGEFNQKKIEKVMGADLSPGDIAEARARQIYIAPMDPAPGVF